MRTARLVHQWRSAAVLLAVWTLSIAAAQFEMVGTVTAKLGDEARTWYALQYDGDDGIDSTVTLSTSEYGFSTITSLHMQAHVDERFSIEGSISIDATLTSALEDCPCAIDNGEILYFSTSSMFNDVYKSIDLELNVDSLEMIGDGVATMSGSFSALLGYVESAMSVDEPDPERTLEIAGEFVIERMLVSEPE